MPNPSYPIHAFGFIIAGASVRHVPIGPGRRFPRELKKAVGHRRCRRRWRSCSISRPIRRRRTVDLDFYGEIVDFCRHHNIWLLSDLAYAEIYFDGKPPPSILQVPGAKDIAVEFTSLSKTYSMAGWRIGFAVGNRG